MFSRIIPYGRFTKCVSDLYMKMTKRERENLVDHYNPDHEASLTSLLVLVLRLSTNSGAGANSYPVGPSADEEAI
jgi:hypothetical protein